jgi:hypothetical protein
MQGKVLRRNTFSTHVYLHPSFLRPGERELEAGTARGGQRGLPGLACRKPGLRTDPECPAEGRAWRKPSEANPALAALQPGKTGRWRRDAGPRETLKGVFGPPQQSGTLSQLQRTDGALLRKLEPQGGLITLIPKGRHGRPLVEEGRQRIEGQPVRLLLVSHQEGGGGTGEQLSRFQRLQGTRRLPPALLRLGRAQPRRDLHTAGRKDGGVNRIRTQIPPKAIAIVAENPELSGLEWTKRVDAVGEQHLPAQDGRGGCREQSCVSAAGQSAESGA